MNKEDVRQKMLDIVGDIYHAHAVATAPSAPFTFDGLTWKEAKDMINKAFDWLEPDNPKVKLPREVGKAWIEYVDSRQTGRGIDKLDMALVFLVREECPNDNVQSWYTVTPGALAILADAYRYGLEAEPEAKWYVQTPKEWWEDKNKPEYFDLDSLGISDGLKCKEYAAQFTRAELKKYHFDSDIFTLVPVEADKEVSR